MRRITADTPIAFADAMPDETDVAVIGGGIAGIATAYYLARKGTRVVVLEKGRIAAEQSGRNWGWIRQQGRDWAELPLVMEANRLWAGLAAETGQEGLAFTRSGCVYLAEDEAATAKQAAWHDVARQHQLDTHILSAREVAARFPDIQGRFVGGMVTPSDGRAEPFVAVPALAHAAQAAGARVVENCAVRTLDIAGGRIVGVITETGRLKAAQVLLAAGAWSSAFARNAGVSLPQLAVRATVARTEAAPETFAENLMTPGITLRRRSDGGYTIAVNDLAEHFVSPASFRHAAKFVPLLRASSRDIRLKPAAPAGFPMAWGTPGRWGADQVSPFERMRVLEPAPSPTVLDRLAKRLPERFPALAGTKIAEAWAGMIDVTPDAVPVLDAVSSVDGLYIATGLSGHGFGIGPAVGRVMADLIAGHPPGHDLTRFRFSRFSDGSPIVPGPY